MRRIVSIILSVFIAVILLTDCTNKKSVKDSNNPFFRSYNTPFDVPPFESIMAKHYIPAFEQGMAEGYADIEKISNNRKKPTFNNTVEALDKAGDLLTKVSNVFFAQASANTSDSIKKLEMEISPALTKYRDDIMLNPVLFKRIKVVYDSKAEFNLTAEQKFLLENLYKSFIRNGANLSKQDQDTLKSINQKLSVLSVQFSQNILAETNNYKLLITAKDTAGLPESLLSAAGIAAKADGQEGKWSFSTQRPSIFPFLQYSPDRDLRKTLYSAYTNRGNNGNDFDNNKILRDILSLRAERAKILGYQTHAHISLEPRMAKNPDNVFKLLNSLWEKAIPVAVYEASEMQKIVIREGGKFKLEPSDWWYYAEKLRKEKYDLDDNELRPYFKLDNVRDGAFTVATKLFGLKFEKIQDIPLPHPDAQAFEVAEADGTPVGVLYMDFYPRESKQQGAWCGAYRSYHLEGNKKVTPVITTVFNFSPPAGDTPALISVEEASILFHEFGHALDALLNKSTYNQTFVAMDFVELPSQIMEHWALEPEVLSLYARHYETNENIPGTLVEKIKNSAYFNQGFETVEYLAASLLDMKYHTIEAPVNIDIESFERDYFASIGLIPEIVSRYRSTYFLHIAGGYDAGYYSYIWAAVLDNDAYEAFREKGIFDRETAMSYRKNILERNGTMDAMEMYKNFRGREPEITPLLKNRGLIRPEISAN